MARRNDKSSGTCRLTGKAGKYIKSHLIPEALTRLSDTGEPYVEAGIGQRRMRRFISWYDSALVIREGEDILARIDSDAMDELRRQRLIWSGWGTEDRLQSNDLVFDGDEPKFRVVRLAQPEVLRLFFMSLAWRAAASKRPEFRSVRLPPDDLEDLRRRVLHGHVGSPEDYPIHLFQIITRGPNHNRTPLLERRRFAPAEGVLDEALEIPYVRFYFDGLVGHVYLARGIPLTAGFLSTCVGFRESTVVFAHESERSRTADNIRELIITVERGLRNPPSPMRPLSIGIRRAWS